MATRQRELGTNSTDQAPAREAAVTSRVLSVHSSPSSRPIRILIIENHRMVADALEALFRGEAGLEVVGSLGSVAAAQAYKPAMRPDISIVDFHLSDGTGTEAVHELRLNGCDAPVIFLTHDDGDLVRLAAVEAGASALLHKSDAPGVLIEAIRRVAGGASLIDPSTIGSLLRKSRESQAARSALTPRETEILRLISAGLASRIIAANLGISYSTVRTHIRSVSGKLGSHSKLESVVRARDLALLS